MSIERTDPDVEKHFARTLETIIRLGLILLLVVWCFSIIKPFIMPVMWGVDR